MKTYRQLPYEHETTLPPEIADDVWMPESFVRHFLPEHTDEGDKIFDPFAGFGTTLRVAEELHRIPYGVEFEPERADHVRNTVAHPEHVHTGDVLALDTESFPPIDCVLTSPPFMAEGMDSNPFENYKGTSDYGTYLEDIRTAFERVETVLATDATVLVHVVNIRDEGTVTTLAWDVADAIEGILRFVGEVVVGWTGDTDRNGQFSFGSDHTYCLVFEAE